MRRTKLSLPRAVSAVALVATAAVSAGGCSGGAGPGDAERTGETAEALVPPFAGPQRCAEGSPRTVYDPPFILLDGGIHGAASAFSDEMTALGCTPETLYVVGPPLAYRGVAFCPTAPPAPVSTMPGDACVGTAPPGWVVAVWDAIVLDAALPQPTGCGGFQCML